MSARHRMCRPIVLYVVNYRLVQQLCVRYARVLPRQGNRRPSGILRLAHCRSGIADSVDVGRGHILCPKFIGLHASGQPRLASTAVQRRAPGLPGAFSADGARGRPRPAAFHSIYLAAPQVAIAPPLGRRKQSRGVAKSRDVAGSRGLVGSRPRHPLPRQRSFRGPVSPAAVHGPQQPGYKLHAVGEEVTPGKSKLATCHVLLKYAVGPGLHRPRHAAPLPSQQDRGWSLPLAKLRAARKVVGAAERLQHNTEHGQGG